MCLFSSNVIVCESCQHDPLITVLCPSFLNHPSIPCFKLNLYALERTYPLRIISAFSHTRCVFPAAPDTYDPFGFDNMDPLADYPPPIRGRGQIKDSPITAQRRVVCYEQVTYDDSRTEGDEYFTVMLINQSATVIVEPSFSSAIIIIIDNDGKQALFMLSWTHIS